MTIKPVCAIPMQKSSMYWIMNTTEQEDSTSSEKEDSTFRVIFQQLHKMYLKTQIHWCQALAFKMLMNRSVPLRSCGALSINVSGYYRFDRNVWDLTSAPSEVERSHLNTCEIWIRPNQWKQTLYICCWSCLHTCFTMSSCGQQSSDLVHDTSSHLNSHQ